MLPKPVIFVFICLAFVECGAENGFRMFGEFFTEELDCPRTAKVCTWLSEKCKGY